ncbi:MAG: hypothetical protein IKU44_04540, partial [Firmicutes bacterium]|nr:hypothetical protein [Bacillota bacterium]
MATVSKENMRKHRENIVKTWNANNSKKINAENLTTAYSKKKQEEERKRKEEEEKRKKEQEEARKKAERERRRKELQAKNRLKQKQTQSNRSKEHKSKSNMNEKTEKIFYDEWNKNKTSRAILGALEGAVKATTGSGIKDDKNRVTEETKKSGAYKAGEVGGQLGAYALGYGAVGGATAKVAGKAVGTQTAKKLTSKLAKNKIVKEAAKKTLKKQGQNATEKAVEHMARKTAKKIAEGMVKGAVADATVGTVLDSNIARSKGYEVGSDEWNKEMLINAGLNLGVGGAVEVAPTVLRALSKSKVAKNVPEAVVKASDNVELPKAKVDEVKAVDVPEVKAKAELPVKNEPVVKATDEAVSVVKNEVPQKTPRQQAYDDAVKLRDELMTKEIASNTEAVKNYEKQGVNVDFTPDRNRLDAGWEASDGFGYTTRSSANEQWYQDFWKKNGRQPNKSEAEAIVREHLENDLAFARNNPNSVGDMELGASSQLREADQKIALMEWEDEALNTYKVEPPETDWTPESGKLMSDKDFMDAIEKQYKTVENMESTAVESGLSKNDWLRMKYDEFYTFGKVDALDLPKETIGGFEVEGSSDLDLGIISKDFKAMEETFDRARTGWERFRKQFVTGQQELERMEKVGGIESTKGRTQALRNAQGTMAYIFNEKLVDSAGKVLDDRSYKQLIHQIPEKDLPDYNTYAQHLHNIYRIRENPDKAVFLQTSAEESKKIVLDLLKDHPEFKDYSREITNWWNKFTKAWLLDTGRMTQQAYDAMLKKYPRYIPTYRVDKGGGFVGLKNPLSAGKAVGSAVGGTSEVKALENGFLEEMQRIVRTTRRNDLYATVIEELRKNPDQLKQFGVAVDDAPTVLADDMTDFLDQIDKEGLKQVKNNVAKVTAYVDGKPVSAYINKELFDALELIENVADSRRYGILFNVGRAITNPLKAGITGLNPVFALANGLRDLPTLYIQSQNGVIKTTSNIGKAIKEIATKGEKYELYKALGG